MSGYFNTRFVGASNVNTPAYS